MNFLDWKDYPVAIIASGPSVNRLDVGLLKDSRFKVVVINNSWILAPWADVLYAADRRWWDMCGNKIVEEFEGTKLTYDKGVAKRFGIGSVELVSENKIDRVNLIAFEGPLGRGGNSGFQALNFVVRCGAKRIGLLGFDFFGDHWHGRHKPPLLTPKNHQLVSWARRLDDVHDSLVEKGIDVVNTSESSILKKYRRSSVSQIIEDWS